MRVDRRVSPNQTVLWTVYELVNSQCATTTRSSSGRLQAVTHQAQVRTAENYRDVFSQFTATLRTRLVVSVGPGSVHRDLVRAVLVAAPPDAALTPLRVPASVSPGRGLRGAGRPLWTSRRAVRPAMLPRGRRPCGPPRRAPRSGIGRRPRRPGCPARAVPAGAAGS